jgi:hypothetical protein
MSTKDSDTTDTSKLYKITADYKNSTYATEQWTNALSNGKQVTILATLEYRSGDFEIELTDAEKESILKKESIVLNDYCVSVNELWSGWGPDIEIKNEDMYTEEEICEIKKLAYGEDEDEDEDFNEIMEENGWSMNDTIYGFTTGCELEEISE